MQPEACFVIHSADYTRANTIAVRALAVTPCRQVLGDIAHKTGPQKVLVAFGYAGWGPGQLEAELARNDWTTAAADADLVFEVNRDRVWDAAMARRSHDR